MEETCIETCFCSTDTSPEPDTIICEEPVSASFCEEACGCGCDNDDGAGYINCLVVEGVCTHDAAEICEAACSCPIVQIRHGRKGEGLGKQFEEVVLMLVDEY